MSTTALRASRPHLASRASIARVAPLQSARPVITRPARQSVQTTALLGGLFGGGAKIDDSKFYICVDCGYIYDDRTPFSEVPNGYKCPVCNSGKRRFKAYAGDIRGRPKNDNKSMVARLKAKEW